MLRGMVHVLSYYRQDWQSSTAKIPQLLERFDNRTSFFVSGDIDSMLVGNSGIVKYAMKIADSAIGVTPGPFVGVRSIEARPGN